jgi:hypothetical protein
MGLSQVLPKITSLGSFGKNTFLHWCGWRQLVTVSFGATPVGKIALATPETNPIVFIVFIDYSVFNSIGPGWRVTPAMKMTAVGG